MTKLKNNYFKRLKYTCYFDKIVAISHVSSVICAFLCVVLGLWMATSGVSNFRGVEGNVVFTIQKALLGSAIYTDPTAPPFDIAQYGPIYYIATILICNLFGIGGLDFSSVFAIGRLVSLSCLGVLVATVYFTLRKKLNVRQSYAVAACAFSIVATSPWYFLARPDAMVAFLIFASLHLAIPDDGATPSRKTLLVLSAIVLGFAAALVKLNGVQVVVAVILYLIIVGDVRKLGIVLLACAVLATMLYFVAPWVFGKYVWDNVIDGVNNGINPSMAIKKVYIRFGIIFCFPMFVFVYSAKKLDVMECPRSKFLLISAGFFFIFGTLTALKEGSALNYYNEFVVLGAMSIAFFFEKNAMLENMGVRSSIENLNFSGRLEWVMPVILLGVILPLITIQRYATYFEAFRSPGSVCRAATERRIDRHQQAAQKLRRQLESGECQYVLAFGDFPAALPDYCVLPQIEVAALCKKTGALDFSQLGTLIDNGSIRYVVLPPGETINREVIGYNLNNYINVWSSRYSYVYEHKKSHHK